MSDPFPRDCFKSLAEPLLRRMETRIVEELAAIGRILDEMSRLTGEAQTDLITLQVWRTAELKAVRTELKRRDDMMPIQIAS